MVQKAPFEVTITVGGCPSHFLLWRDFMKIPSGKEGDKMGQEAFVIITLVLLIALLIIVKK